MKVILEYNNGVAKIIHTVKKSDYKDNETFEEFEQRILDVIRCAIDAEKLNNELDR